MGCLLAFMSVHASAAACPEDVDRRLAFIDQGLAAGVGAARRHSYGWGGVQATSLAVHSTLFFAGPEASRVDRVAGATTAAAGLVVTVLAYPALLRDQPRVAELASKPSTCARLAEMERLLVVDAQQEARSRSWVRHALSLGFNLAVGLVLGAGYQRWTSAALGSGVSAAVGELIILTRPTTATETLDAYLRW